MRQAGDRTDGPGFSGRVWAAGFKKGSNKALKHFSSFNNSYPDLVEKQILE